MMPIRLTSKDALILVDVQNDFLPGGALAVPDAGDILPSLHAYIDCFQRHELPIYATRDWHPPDHCSFLPQGGIWPPHCVAGTPGAQFPADLRLPASATVISKAATPHEDAYSGFQGTALAGALHARRIDRLFIGGLATDYCVLNTVKDALLEDFKVFLLVDAIKAVDVLPGDGESAIQDMLARGAEPITLADMEACGGAGHGPGERAAR